MRPFLVQPTGIAGVALEVREHRRERGGAEWSTTTRGRGRRGPRRAGRQTRATQWSSPSGRLSRELRRRLAVEPGEHPADHAPVEGAHHVGVPVRGVAERAALRDDAELAAVLLGVRGEPVRGERVGDRADRGAHRTVAGVRVHPGGERSAVLVADVVGEAGGLVGPERVERTGEQPGEHVVVLEGQRERGVELDRAVALRRPAGSAHCGVGRRGGRPPRRGSRRR